jgi:hypothetical protein
LKSNDTISADDTDAPKPKDGKIKYSYGGDATKNKKEKDPCAKTRKLFVSVTNIAP